MENDEVDTGTNGIQEGRGSIIGIVIVVVLIAIGGWFLFMGKGNSTTDQNTDQSAAVDESGTSTATTAPMSATVTYTDTGYSPTSVTIAQGGTVTFVNQSSHPMWTASDPHPLHSGYDGTSRSEHCVSGYAGPAPFDQCGTTSTYTFTFTKAGTWGYHNHAVDEDRGTIIVTAS